MSIKYVHVLYREAGLLGTRRAIWERFQKLLFVDFITVAMNSDFSLSYGTNSRLPSLFKRAISLIAVQLTM